MYKVVLADDEPMIIRGLKKMVDWERLNAVLVGEAENGEQLCRLVREVKPDIVISDIAMPVKSGLDVIRQMYEEGRHTKVIFLTGFQEFSYAKSAVTYGAVDYLLKPVRKEELEKAVLQAEKLLKKDMGTEELWTPAGEDQLEAVFQHMNAGYDSQDIYRQFQELGIEIREKELIGVCFSTQERPQESAVGSKFELLRFSAFQRIQEILKTKKSGFVIKRDEKQSNVIFLLPEGYERKSFGEQISLITDSVLESFGLVLHVGIGECVDTLSKLQYTHKTAMFTSELHFFLEQPVIWYEDVNREFCHSFEEYDLTYKQFVHSVLNKRETYGEELSCCLSMIEALHFGNRYAAENRCMMLAMDFFRELCECGMADPGDQQCRAEYERAVEELRRCVTYRELREKVTGLIEGFRVRVTEGSKYVERQVIREVKAYISSHFAEDISLNQLAHMVFMNPNYLSIFFKKETGENFKDYLTQIRMKEALKLLQEQDIKTYELARLVGYKDVRSFTEKFRKYYGSSPSEYRKK